MPLNNPFTPAFGGKPQHFFGRRDELALSQEALENEFSPHRALFITANRGFGKTALLEKMSEQAAAARWITVDVHSTDAARSIIMSLQGGSARSEQRELRPQGLGVSIGSSTTAISSEYVPSDLPQILVGKLQGLTLHRGVFISVDEAQKLTEADAEPICSAVQMALRKGLPAMLVLAGLPGAKERIASFAGCTFMWRTRDIKLGSLHVDETREAFTKMFAITSDIIVQDDALEAAVQMSKGHPYLVQLAGYHAVELVRERYGDAARQLTRDIVRAIEPLVLQAYGRDVLKPAFAPLRGNTVGYLRALSRCMDDEGKASTSEIAAQLGKTTTQCSMYRERLLERRLIVPAGRGFVRFGLPYCPQYFDEEDAIGDASAEWRY
jgi:hypothetical protein